MTAKMLGKAGRRGAFIFRRHGDSTRCACRDCTVQPLNRQQRSREKRQWRREALT